MTLPYSGTGRNCIEEGFANIRARITYQMPELAKSPSLSQAADVRRFQVISTCRSLLRSLNTIEKFWTCEQDFPVSRT